MTNYAFLMRIIETILAFIVAYGFSFLFRACS